MAPNCPASVVRGSNTDRPGALGASKILVRSSSLSVTDMYAVLSGTRTSLTGVDALFSAVSSGSSAVPPTPSAKRVLNTPVS